MQKLIAATHEILSRQRDVYRDMLAAMRSSEQAMRAYDTPRVDELNKVIETLALRAKALVEARFIVNRRLAEALGVEQTRISTDRVAGLASPTVGTSIRALGDEISSLAPEIAAQNELNRSMARSSLLAVQGLARLMRQTVEQPITYGPTAAVRRSSASAGRLQGSV